MARPRTTPSRTLAKVHDANQAPVAADRPGNGASFQAPPPGDDDFRLHLHMVSHLDPGYALSKAQAEIMEARTIKGDVPAFRAKIARAMEALRVADAQAALTAIAMCVVLPAWVGVILKCARIV